MGREKKEVSFRIIRSLFRLFIHLFVCFFFCVCSGRLFDKDGNLKDWWSQSSTRNFLLKSYCLVNQYNNYEVFGHDVSSYLYSLFCHNLLRTFCREGCHVA